MIKLMDMSKYILMLINVLILISACENETLEDTYREYAGDGEIRYIGKCSDVSVRPGWKKMIVKWAGIRECKL